MNLKKCIIQFLFICFSACFLFGENNNSEESTSAAPSLQIGLGGIGFRKGMLDQEVIAAIIKEKQDEIKVKLVREMVLDKIEMSGGTFYAFVDNLITNILNETNPELQIKSTLENTVNLAFIAAFLDFYMATIKEKSVELTNLNKLSMAYGFLLPPDYKRIPKPNKIRDWRKLQIYSEIQEENKFGKKINESLIETQFIGLLFDIVSEVIRENNELKRLGLLQVNYSTRALNKNLYAGLKSGDKKVTDYQFLKAYAIRKKASDNYYLLQTTIQSIADSIINLDDKKDTTYFNKLIEGCAMDTACINKTVKKKKEEWFESISILTDSLSSLKVLINKNKETQSVKRKDYADAVKENMDSFLSKLILNIGLSNYLSGTQSLDTTLLQNNSNPSEYADAAVKIYKRIISENKLNETHQENIAKTLKFLNTVKQINFTDNQTLNYSQILYQLSDEIIPSVTNIAYTSELVVDAMDTLNIMEKNIASILAKNLKSDGYDYLFTKNQNDIFYAMLNSLYKFNSAETYAIYLKTLGDIGDIFPNEQVQNTINSITEVATRYIYFIQEDGKTYVSFDTEGVLCAFQRITYYKNRIVQPHLTIGANIFVAINKKIPVNEDKVKSNFYLSEKIGLKIKIIDWKYLFSFDPGEIFTYYGKRYVCTKSSKEPFISNIHLLVFGSGLLYNLINTGTTKDFNSPIVAGGVGVTIFNDLDFNLSLGLPFIENSGFNKDNLIVNFGVDFQFSEYINKLGEKRKNVKSIKLVGK